MADFDYKERERNGKENNVAQEWLMIKQLIVDSLSWLLYICIWAYVCVCGCIWGWVIKSVAWQKY